MKRKQVTFEMLESISTAQADIRKRFLLYCGGKTARKRTAPEDRKRRKRQFEELKKSMPDVPSSNDSLALKRTAKQWRDDEVKWAKKHSGEYEREVIINSLSYRLLSLFFLNHIACPFYIEGGKGRKKPDDKDFHEENQKLFRKFLNQSADSYSEQIQFLKKINISESVISAAHKLYSKDWDIAKGLLIGGSAGAATGIFLGPVIGAYIGNLAGFSGAAATSYGLALLGGGSLASGGLGMAGGSAFLGLGFGIANGVRHGVKGASIDELNLMQTQRVLPVSLAISRALFENKDAIIPNLIHRTVSKRLKAHERRLKKLKNKYDEALDSSNEKKWKNLEKSIKVVEKNVKLYRRAKDMSRDYDWQSGYDMWKDIKSWAS